MLSKKDLLIEITRLRELAWKNNSIVIRKRAQAKLREVIEEWERFFNSSPETEVQRYMTCTS